jgi:hypothetical protein
MPPFVPPRAAPRAASRHRYAKTYSGRNGCDVEIVIEFQPKEGGGLEIEAGINLESMAKETEAALRASVKTYATDDEIIVTAGLKQIREGQFVEALPCEDVDVEIIRFAKQFVCKATGQKVAADIAFLRANDQYVPVSSSSTTSFQTDPPTTFAYHEDGTTTISPKFRITLGAAAAPESCGSLYCAHSPGPPLPLLSLPLPASLSLLPLLLLPSLLPSGPHMPHARPSL